MTFGQLFTQMHPDIKVKENGTCVWIYFDDVNYYTFGADWWNAEIKEQPEIVRCRNCKYQHDPCNCFAFGTDWHDGNWFCADGVKR